MQDCGYRVQLWRTQSDEVVTTPPSAERLLTDRRNEISLGIILHKLERLDAKIDQISRQDSDSGSTYRSTTLPPSKDESPPRDSAISKATPISFSAHLMLDWPAVRAMLPPAAGVPKGNYSLKLEDQRPSLPPTSGRYADSFLADLSVSRVRELSDAYFATFNLANPVLDRKLYFQRTLGAAINGGFGYDADSCVVLMTMALGCWGLQVLSKQQPSPHTHYHSSPVSDRHYQTPSEQGYSSEPAGLAFYNEARKRIGFLDCKYDMEICQFYLLAAIYHGQLLRPADCWSMTTRAATCCLRFWENPPLDGDEWALDMFSRLFWITVMHQTVLTQELVGLPGSKIRDMEDQVPLPKFVQFKQPSYPTAPDDEDESFYHYHFLSQIAHRIFLTRVYNSSYYCSKSVQPTILLY